MIMIRKNIIMFYSNELIDDINLKKKNFYKIKSCVGRVN